MRDRKGLLQSLRNPHPDSIDVAEEGFSDWVSELPAIEDDLVDHDAGTAVRWVEGRGWVEVS